MFVAIITVVLFKFFCYIYTTSVRECSIAICCQQKSDCSLSGFNIEPEERKKISILAFLSGSNVRRICKPGFAWEEGDFWLLLSLAQLVSHSPDSIYLM
jgi:hypothetical protein